MPVASAHPRAKGYATAFQSKILPVAPRRWPGSTSRSSTATIASACQRQLSESWIAVQPGTENLVGPSKVFFEKFSTFYNFHLGCIGSSTDGPAASNIVQGYECVSTGTQEMPPSWTNDTDPNVDFDSRAAPTR